MCSQTATTTAHNRQLFTSSYKASTSTHASLISTCYFYYSIGYILFYYHLGILQYGSLGVPAFEPSSGKQDDGDNKEEKHF